MFQQSLRAAGAFLKAFAIAAVAILVISCTGSIASSPSPTAGSIASSPSPTAFAPEDLAFTLPREIGGITLTITEVSAEEALRLPGAGEAIRRLMVDSGKTSSDLLAATATGRLFTQEAAKQLSIVAVRIRGVPADGLAALMYSASAPGSPTFAPTVANGRPVLEVPSTDPQAVSYFYFKGEAMYGVSAVTLGTGGDPRVLAAEVVSALP